MADPGHQYSEKVIAAVKKKAAAVYKAAEDKCQRKMTNYIRKCESGLRTALERLERGEISRDEYELWCQTEIFTREWNFIVQYCSNEMLNANRQVAEIINGALAAVYAENYNYGAYQVEVGDGR